MTVAVASPFTYSHTIGFYQMAGRGFSHPVDQAIGPDGRIYVVNRGNPGQAENCVRVTVTNIDDDDLGQFSGYGSGDGQLTWATSIAIDSQYRVYISDEHRQDIQVFDRDGTFIAKWGTFGSEPGLLNRPSGLAFDRDDNLYVVDHLNHRVQVFTSTGTYLAGWGERGTGPGQFSLPWGITVDGRGHVYVADWGNDRIQEFTADGAYVRSYGESGRSEGQLWRPSWPAVAADGTVVVADRGNDRTQAYTADGLPLATLYGESTLSKWAIIWLDGNPDIVERRSRTSTEPEKYFWAPSAVDVLPDGRVLALDTCRHRIQVYGYGAGAS